MRDIRLCDNSDPAFSVELCRKYGLGIEIQSFIDPYIIEKDPFIKRRHLDLLSCFTYPRSLHAPFWEMNIGSRMRDIYDATIKMYSYAHGTAKELECSEIIVHNGYIPNTYGEEGWISRSIGRWTDFLNERDDICFFVENQFERSSSMICQIIDGVNNENLKFCLDIGHVNAHAEESVRDWIKNAKDRIGYVHMHNNSGIKDEHNGFEKGNIPIIEICELLEKYSPNAVWSIETSVAELENSYLFLKSHFSI